MPLDILGRTVRTFFFSLDFEPEC